MKVRRSSLVATLFASALAFTAMTGRALAAEEYGIFERILEASGSFADTTAALEKALAESNFKLQGKRDLTYTDKMQQARVYVLTSPAYIEAAKDEAPNSISAQILRIGVYEYGKGKPTQINMANPIAHAMVYYSGSKNYDKLVAAAKQTAQELRDVAAKVPGKPVSVQLEPKRSESAYNSYNGDSMARMMAKFRKWNESQNPILTAKPEEFEATVAKIENAFSSSKDKGVDDASGWTLVAKVPVGPNAVYFGVTNSYTENKAIRINSDFRSEGKSDDAMYPGVDHAPALPLDVLVYNDGKETRAIHYGQMWRMQLYFWDSGYMAFAKNTLIPSVIFGSIEKTVGPEGAPAAGKTSQVETGGKLASAQ